MVVCISLGAGLLFAAAGCAGERPATRSARIASATLAPCHRLGDQAECGYLVVPEDPHLHRGRSIRLHVVVLRALEPRTGAAPLFHLEGGPGVAASTAAIAFYLGPGRRYRRYRDVVLVDQRGTGRSHPLRCPEIERRSALDDQYRVEDVAACRARLVQRADLGHYGTANAADDLDRVRAALGYERIDLWALSYGTQLAQVYLRSFPGRVRRAVLAGVAPLDFPTPLPHAVNAQRVLDRLFEQCGADPACDAAYPTLHASWETVLARVSAGAIPGLRRGPFGEAVRRLLETTTQQRRLPYLIDRAARGDVSPLLQSLRALRDPTAEGLYLSVACAEGTLRIAEEDVRSFTAGTFVGDHRVRNQLSACRRWPVRPVPRTFFAPPGSGAAVLILSGEMDATTPPAYARRVCAALRCHLVSFPLLAHGPFDLDAWKHGDCFDRIAVAFYEAEDPSVLDTSCVAAMQPPPFAVGVRGQSASLSPLDRAEEIVAP